MVTEERVERLERYVAELEVRLVGVEGKLAPAPRAAEPRPAPAPARLGPTPLLAAAERPRPAAPRPTPVRAQLDLEQLVGGRLLGWVGGIALVVGLALLLALGISEGWIGEQARTLMAGAFSSALLCAGVWLHERKGRTQAARAAVGAAICGLFMTITVATAVYGLIPAAVGIVLAFATGALATALAVRWSSPVVGALGILGAVASPLLVDAQPSATTVAFEAIAVAGGAAVLLRERWNWLALGVFGLSAPQWLRWLFEDATTVPALLVLTLFGVLYAAAALGFELRVPTERLRTSSAFLLGLNALTLALAGWARLELLDHLDLAKLWLAALAAAYLVAGVLARRSRRISDDVALLCLTLGVGIADVAFALTADGVWRTVGFAGAGVLFAAIARGRRNRHDAALAQLGLGAHVAFSALQAVGDVDSAQLLTAGANPPAVAGLVALAAGCLVSGRLAEDGLPEWRVLLDATGLLALAGVALLTLEGTALTAAWAAQAIALARIAERTGDRVAGVAAYAHLVAAGIFALADQAQPEGLIDGDTALLPATLGLGAVAAATAVLAYLRRAFVQERRPLVAAVALTLLYLASLAVVALSPAPLDGGAVEQGQLQLSALWSVAGVGALLAGLRQGSRDLRAGALALLALTVAKVFLYDLAALTSVYRVGSFLALGLLLLLAALAYQRMRPEPLSG